MADFSRFGIEPIDTHYTRPGHAAAHLLMEGDQVAVVDCGTTLAVPLIVEALTRRNLELAQVSAIIATHIHLDHAGGAGALLAQCPRATLYVHYVGAAHLIDPAKLSNAATSIYGEELFGNRYGVIVPAPAERVVAVEDGFELQLAGRVLRFYDTPGHARHHCCIWDEKSRGVFAGDAFGIGYKELRSTEKHEPFLFPTSSPAAFDPAAMETSIMKMMELAPDYLYITHYGPVVAAPAAVARLLDQVRGFAALLPLLPGLSHDQLAARVFAIISEAYMDYLGNEAPPAELVELLTEDVDLNAQGIEIWGKRMWKNG
jgi:glyoxylase-like metal-dependent hydrolase (beta-lactamase superfamily II)